MKEFLKKYKTQIINVITIFLILEFAIYPGLTTANTVSNILAGIGLLLLIIWGGLALYQYVTSDKGGIVHKEELKEAEQMVKETPKPKRKPKTTK
jgi:ABC-type multidrug transport system fused ATPase/permease subunit